VLKSIIRFSLNNKFALWIITLIVTVAGLYSGFNMKMETLPDVTIPIVTISTVYPGAAPEEVMDKISKPFEQSTRNLDGVTNVTSTSMENMSSITIEYKFGKDMKAAVSEINEAISKIKLPDGAQPAKVSRLSFNAFPVMSLSISSDGQSLDELTKIVEDSVVPHLQSLQGVASVQVSGQHLNEVQLTFNKEKMKSLGLSEETVKGVIQASAVNIPLGIYQFGETEKAVVVDGHIISLDDLKNLAIPAVPSIAGGASAAAGGAQGPGNAGTSGTGAAAPQQQAAAGKVAAQAPAPTTLPTIKLSEIADVQIVGKAASISHTNGKESIGISVVKAADANTVDVVNKVKAEIVNLEKQSPNIAVTTVLDQGKPIQESVSTMVSKALIGALFAVLIILLFLRDIRSTIISIVSIPLSILIAMLVLRQFNITLNIMTLGAMTVAIGRVVDDSIVVIENIYRRMSLTSEKLKGRELVLEATREMFIPIMASTIVTIAVFLPMGLVSGVIGQIFLPFALTIVFSLLASLLVAVTVVPMMAHMLFRKGLKSSKQHDDQTGKLSSFYKRGLRWSLNHKAVTFGTAIVLLLGSFFLVPLIGFSFISSGQDKTLTVTYNPAPGQTKESVVSMAEKAEKSLLGRTSVSTIQYSIGGDNSFRPGATNQALFYLLYDKNTPNFEKEKKDVLALLSSQTDKGEWKELNMGGGGIGGSKTTMTVYGPNMEQLGPVVAQIMDIMKKNSSLDHVDSSISKTYSQYKLVANQAKLSQYGLTAGQIAMVLSPVRQQPVLTTIQKDGKALNVYLNVETKTYSSKSDLENVKLRSPLGMEVTLKDVADIQEGTSPNTITRKDDRIYAEVSADITTKDVSKVSADIKKSVDALKLPSNVEVQVGGVTQQINDSFSQLGLAMLAAVAIVYLILVITFGGGLTPLTILFSLPFTIIGGLLALWLAGETLSVTAMIGALMLIGIVVTNAIVLIDRVIQKQKEGLPVREALLEAAATRLRPILMTALATIGALLPLAFGFESGGLISKGLGVTVIGGLTSSTILTLVIVPVVYEFLSRFQRKSKDA
jgi:HAE1 family hydrophobic/amphiphilic exporter-1